MKRLSTLILALTLLALIVALARPAAAAALNDFFYDFNATLEPFEAGAADQSLVNDQTLRHEFERALAVSDSRTSVNGYAALTNDTGTLAVYMMTDVHGVGQAVRIQLLAKDLDGCARCALIVYTGSAKPDGIAGFAKVDLLKKSWNYYEYQAMIDTDDVVVAIGIMNLDQTNTVQRAGVDNMQITFLDD